MQNLRKALFPLALFLLLFQKVYEYNSLLLLASQVVILVILAAYRKERASLPAMFAVFAGANVMAYIMVPGPMAYLGFMDLLLAAQYYFVFYLTQEYDEAFFKKSLKGFGVCLSLYILLFYAFSKFSGFPQALKTGGIILGNTNTAASAVAIFMPLYLLDMLDRKNIMMNAVMLAFSAAALYVLGSLGAAVAALVSFSALFYIKAPRGKKKHFLALAGLIAFTCILLVYFKVNDLTSLQRVRMWKVSAQMIKENALKGTGINSFAAAYPSYSPYEKWEFHPHNFYLLQTVEKGLPYGLFFAALVALALYLHFKAGKFHLFLMLLAVSVHGLFDAACLQPFMLAIFLSLIFLAFAGQVKKPVPPLYIAVLVFIAAIHPVRLYLSEANFAEGARKSDFSKITAAKKYFNNPAYCITLGGLYMKKGEYASALTEFDIARSLSPNDRAVSALYHTVRYISGNEEALSFKKEIGRLAGRDLNSKYLDYAMLLYITGKDTAALSAALNKRKGDFYPGELLHINKADLTAAADAAKGQAEQVYCARAMLDLDMKEEGLALLEKASSGGVMPPGLAYYAAGMFLEAGRAEKAALMTNGLTYMDPGNHLYFLLRAKILYALSDGKFKEALAGAEKLNPAEPLLYEFWGDMAADKNTAEGYYKKALALAPGKRRDFERILRKLDKSGAPGILPDAYNFMSGIIYHLQVPYPFGNYYALLEAKSGR